MATQNVKKLPMVTTTALIAAISVLVLGTTTDAFAAPIYNPDMTDWWGDMIEALGNKPSTTWTEPGWGSDLWVEIENIGTDMYRISLYGIAASGKAISYMITETDDGYVAYGPQQEDGSMAFRTYVTSAGSGDGDVQTSVSVTNPRTSDIHRNTTSHPTVGKQILLISNITNHGISEQAFVWLVRIADSDGIVESISWVNGTLNPGEILGLETSWLPTKTGDYKATFFVWKGIEKPIALSYPAKLGFTVLEKPTESATNKRITIEIGEPVNEQGLLPIITTETTERTERLGFVTDWNFLPLNHGERGPTGERLSWDVLPREHRYFAISGQKEGMQVEVGPMVSREDILHGYPVDCHEMSIKILSAQPVTIEIPEGLSSVSVTVSDAGLLPVNGLYKLEFASFFDHHIQLPENATVRHSERTVCSVDRDDFSTILYDVVIFHLETAHK